MLRKVDSDGDPDSDPDNDGDADSDATPDGDAENNDGDTMGVVRGNSFIIFAAADPTSDATILAPPCCLFFKSK